MTSRQKANVGGWLLLLFGVVLTAIGGVVLWAVWDAPPESVNQRWLLLPFVFGLPSLVFGLYSVIRNDPLEDDGRVRYPYLFQRARDRAPVTRIDQRSWAAGNVTVGVFFGVLLLLVLGVIVYGVLVHA